MFRGGGGGHGIMILKIFLVSKSYKFDIQSISSGLKVVIMITFGFIDRNGIFGIR